MKRGILVILGHPDADSLCAALADAYSRGAREAGADVRELRLGELEFDPVLWKGYRIPQELEPDLRRAREEIRRADHLVWVFPVWWGTMPALLKGFLDRALLPGFGFRFRKNSPFWDKLLKGRTAESLVTMDTPSWYYRWVYHRPGHYQMKRMILGFCGIRLTRRTEFSPVRNATPEKRERWLRRAERLGRKAGASRKTHP